LKPQHPVEEAGARKLTGGYGDTQTALMAEDAREFYPGAQHSELVQLEWTEANPT